MFKKRQFKDELSELYGWSGLKRSGASLRVTTLIYDFGPALLAGIYALFEHIAGSQTIRRHIHILKPLS